MIMENANVNMNLSLNLNQLIQLVRQLPLTDKIKLTKILAKETIKKDKTKTYFASESVLAKDWLNPEEDEAWKDL